MTKEQILALLEPKNQGLPMLKSASAATGYPVFCKPVFDEKPKKKRHFVQNSQLIMEMGIGPKKEMGARKIRRWYGEAYLAAAAGKPDKIAMACPPSFLKYAAVGVHMAALDPAMLKPKWKPSSPEVAFVDPAYKTPARAETAIREGEIVAEGKNLMRVLGALPDNMLNVPAYASVIQALAKRWGIKCERVPKEKLKKYELLNSVAFGSRYPSELLILTMEPKSGKTKKETVVIGKGICFDSGGLMTKAPRMKYMKEDMAGSAAILGAILTMRKLGKTVKETTRFMVALAENLINENATRPDDIWKAGDGQTVEITNTDAEGRLVLADAICYAKANFKNACRFFTIATLTGSCIQTLGQIYTGAVTNTSALQKQFEKIGRETGDLVHFAPWDMEYDDLDSPVADTVNQSDDKDAGWIKAALFLNRFIPEGAQFCHFDIAGSVDMKEKGNPWRRKGFNSGVCVELLTR
ncbi:hypothetical protein JXA05_04530 [Candidatus Peregrinibacteria bacterium]|nr:hypothetical protein [Candidatus Peregrinibacteria bacterium]